MKITALKSQVKNPNRISVFVDEKYSFSLGPDMLLDLKLRTGLEITNEQLAGFKQASDFGKAYERALGYATLRPRSIKEMQDYLWRKKADPGDAQAIIAKLQSRRYLDDVYFAKAWVQNRALGKKYSLRKLRLELKQKGITDEIANQAIEQSDFSENTALQNIIAKKQKLARYKADPQKLMRYLVGQGFSYDAVKQALAGDA